MRLKYVSIEGMKWPAYWHRLSSTAAGGGVVIFLLALLTHGCFPASIQERASKALAAASVMMNPDGTVLVAALFLVLAYFVLASSPLLGVLSQWIVQPAVEFCKDAALVGIGVCLALGILGSSEGGSSALEGGRQATILVMLASILHLAREVMRAWEKAEAEAVYIPKWHRVATAAIALIALVSISVIVRYFPPPL